MDASETALLLPKAPKKRTPIPWLQAFVLLLIQVCEPLAGQSIYPYINQLISEMDIVGGDKRKVGYYAGLIESLFYFVQALTILQWSRLSDRIGRKPVTLMGLFGLSISMLYFGMSRTFWTLVISRSLCGLLNGNIGVVKSALAELTDSTNRAEVFGVIPVIWATGSTLGPMMGGALYKPNERFPGMFEGEFWTTHPHFLPSLVSSAFVLCSAIITIIFFRETMESRPSRLAFEGVSASETSSRQLTVRQLLVYPVVISVANYTSLALLDICMLALIPLFLAMPLKIGGLGLSPLTIGYTLGYYGAFMGTFQVLFFAKIVRHFGERRVFLNGITGLAIAFLILPLTSYVAQRQGGVTTVVWLFIAVLPPILVNVEMAFGCISIYIAASAPKGSLGATNGLAQTTVGIARAIGPAMATSLFSFSVERNLLGGYAVYLILFVLTCLIMALAIRLPEEMWSEDDD